MIFYILKMLGQCRYARYPVIVILTGQSHEKVGEMRVEGDGLGPN
jgi:hypothetical protein